jgi:stress-induced morphogen
MERAAQHALRSCRRVRMSDSSCAMIIRSAAPTRGCIASGVCPARAASTNLSPQSHPPAFARKQTPLRANIQWKARGYATGESSTGGTIGKGEADLQSEAQKEKVREALVAPDTLDEAEKDVWDVLERELQPTELSVRDISGGCGSMYGIEIVAERFRGMGMLKQQRLVNEVLGERVKGWHGVQLRTRVPE